MAKPTIVYNNSTGSATAASGAGPATALTGTSASYSGSVFTLDGSPDLSGVATDGSHAIFVQTTTGRRLFEITAVDDGADTVTVANAPSGTSSGLSWALGGKRNSPFDTDDSTHLSTHGRAGWYYDLEDTGSAYTLTAQQNIIGGDDIDGPVKLMSSGTRALIQSTTAVRTIGFATDFVHIENLEIFNNRGSGSIACIYSFHSGNMNNMVVRNCHLRSQTTSSHYLLHTTRATQCSVIEGNHFDGKSNTGGGAARGYYIGGSGGDAPMANIIANNYFEGCSNGVEIQRCPGTVIIGNIFNDCTTNGINLAGSSRTEACKIIGNTIYNATSAGINFVNAFDQIGCVILGNIIHSCGTYAVNAQGAEPRIWSDYNFYYNNTSGVAPSNTMTQGANDSTSDPGLTDPANDDFSLTSGANASGAGWPASWLGLSSTTGEPDAGAVHRAPGGAGGIIGARRRLQIPM